MPLERRVVVTGGSGGIGTPFVRLLAENGAEVYSAGRTRSSIPAAKFLEADLADESSTLGLAKTVAELEPDILVHLAGSQYFGPYTEQSACEVSAGYRVNLIAPAILTRAVLPSMQRRGRGHVAFVGSVFGAIPFAHFAAYSSAKAGIDALCRALEREYAGSGIRFSHAVPRAVSTAMATPKIRQFAKIANFGFDKPENVAQRLFNMVADGDRELGPGFPESFLMRLSAIAPGLLSRGLAGTNRKARRLLASPSRLSNE